MPASEDPRHAVRRPEAAKGDGRTGIGKNKRPLMSSGRFASLDAGHRATFRSRPLPSRRPHVRVAEPQSVQKRPPDTVGQHDSRRRLVEHRVA